MTETDKAELRNFVVSVAMKLILVALTLTGLVDYAIVLPLIRDAATSGAADATVLTMPSALGCSS